MPNNSAVIRTITIALLLQLASAIVAVAQVKITLHKQHYIVQEQIRPDLENRGTGSVTICVEFGQWSPKGANIESTPMPFGVEQNNKGKWHTLLIGPDIGSIRRAVPLEAGKSLEFPFRLNDTGTMRLRLNYWLGPAPSLDCTSPPKRAKNVKSVTFSVE